MSGEEINGTMDAQRWAVAFIETINRIGRDAIDESLMIAWFANAIMSGYDIGYSRGRAEESQSR